MKHCFILGTRPEIIKLYSCIKYCGKNNLEHFIIHTNQHYSENMDKVFFDELGLEQAKYNLNINGGTHGGMTGRMLIEIEKVLLNETPDIIYVQGDTNTVLAGALAATKLGIKVAHIEAGLRSYDRSMPEETNRIVTDHISDYLFAPTFDQRKILLGEGIDESKIFVTGNTIVDAVFEISDSSKKYEQKILAKYGFSGNDYILLTSHRPSNVDSKENLEKLLIGINNLKYKSGKKILFPVHPRTNSNITKFGLVNLIEDFVVIDPIGFVENVILENNSFMIATDSGGIQEEGCILKKKTLILRENTERPETLEVGGAILVGNDPKKIIDGYNELLNRNVNWTNPFGDGNSAKNIIKIIEA